MNKAALITGGAKRVGKHISLYLAEKGYDIALHFNRSGNEAEETAEAARSQGVECEIFQCDLSDMSLVGRLVPRVLERFPNCSLLINNASVFEDTGFQEITGEKLERDLAVNFKSPVLLSRAFSECAQAEHIINMLDMRVSKVETDHFIYNLSKKALKDFTLSAAKALGPGIRVNGICPGPIMPPPGEGDEYLLRVAKDTPLGKPGSPAKITAAIGFLLDNDYITGECLFVDGGQHLI